MLFISNVIRNTLQNVARNLPVSVLGVACLSAVLFVTAPTQVFAQAVPSSDESEVVIRKGGNGETYYEYRVAGQIKEIRVVPKEGKTYYLVPQEGQYIKMDRSQLLVPSWIIFEW